MIIFLGFYFLILISVIGYGFLFQSIFYKDSIKNLLYGKFIGFYGLALITFISYFTNLFYPHGFLHNSIIHIVGFSFGIFYIIEKKKYVLLKNLILISLLLLLAIFISKPNEDFPYYHLPYTNYLIENKLIFGMGHLNHGYNLLSSIFNFNSTLYLPYIKFYSFHYVYLFFLVFFNYYCLVEIFKDKKIDYIKIFYILSILYFNSSFTRLAEYGTDKPGQLLIVILFISFLKILTRNGLSKNIAYEKIIFLIPLIFYCITLKAYFLPYFLIFVSLIFFFKKEFYLYFTKFLKNKIFIFCFLFLILMFLHFFISSGCLIAPISQTCFGDIVFWGKDIEAIKSLNTWLEQWSKAGAGPNFRIEDPLQYIIFPNWVDNWVNKYFLIKAGDQIGIYLISVFLIFFSLFKKLKNEKIIKTYNLKLFFVIQTVIFLVWFLKHPTLRYGGYAACFLFFSIPVTFYLSKFTPRKNFFRNVKFLLILVIVIFNLKNIDRINKEFKRVDIYKYDNFPYYKIKVVKYKTLETNSNLKIYSSQGDQCWATPSPCVKYGSFSGTIKSAFGYYLISNKK
tara:strand:+ start:1241 stop:2935 length:1695 start_codon:yes stop_codon:yes gene_type:complete